MKGLLFLGFLLVVVLVAAYGLSKQHKKEGFLNPGSDESLKSPEVIVPKVDPAYGPLEGTAPGPYDPPTEKVYGPAFGEESRVNTLPYKNPELEAAKYKRIAEVLESLKGFFTFEAKSLQNQSDPVVQLPLQTARGDMQRLTDEVAVLKRNPGIDSALTQGQVDDIQANLAYLQRRHRLSVNSASIESIEGFTSSSDNATATTTASQGTGRRLNLNDLKEVQLAVQVEITRLSASGTTDPVTVARVNTLTNIKNGLTALIAEVTEGTRPESEIPIFESDKKSFLPAMSDPNKPLPKLVNEAGLPPSVANLFPATGPGNLSGSKVAQTLFTQYGDAVFKGLSWGANINVKYISENEVAASKAHAVKKAKAKKAGFTHSEKVTIDGKEHDLSLSYKNVPQTGDYSFPRGEMESHGVSMDTARAAGAPPAKFDWKKRYADVCLNVKKSGLNPGDFGCIPTTTKVGPDYSWRGAARMVCTRLLTTPNPGLPEQCGCPPLNWPGWRS